MQSQNNIIRGAKAIGAEYGFSEDTFLRLVSGQGALAKFVADGTIWKAGRTSPWRMFSKDVARVRLALVPQSEAAE